MDAVTYKAEYAKSGRAKCKLCKSAIGNGLLRLAILKDSSFHRGKDTHWFHSSCFFQSHRPETVKNIEGYQTLKSEDQAWIKSKIETPRSSLDANKSSREENYANASLGFVVGYAKSSRSTCMACNQKIPIDYIRISKKDYASRQAMMFGLTGGMDRWYHFDCFIVMRDELGFNFPVNTLAGFNDLKKEDQEMLEQTFPVVKSQSPSKK